MQALLVFGMRDRVAVLAVFAAALLVLRCGGNTPSAPVVVPMPTPVPSPACVATARAQYVISGGPKATDHFNVDDWLHVDLNGERIAEGSICFPDLRQCPGSAPIQFDAGTGGLLRLRAEDANACYSLDALYLQKTDGTCLTTLNDAISGPNCDSEPPMQVFFDRTYVLP